MAEKLPQNVNDEEESGRKSRAANTNKTKTQCTIYIITDGMSNVHCSLLCKRAYAC